MKFGRRKKYVEYSMCLRYKAKYSSFHEKSDSLYVCMRTAKMQPKGRFNIFKNLLQPIVLYLNDEQLLQKRFDGQQRWKIDKFFCLFYD